MVGGRNGALQAFYVKSSLLDSESGKKRRGKYLSPIIIRRQLGLFVKKFPVYFS